MRKAEILDNELSIDVNRTVSLTTFSTITFSKKNSFLILKDCYVQSQKQHKFLFSLFSNDEGLFSTLRATQKRILRILYFN